MNAAKLLLRTSMLWNCDCNLLFKKKIKKDYTRIRLRGADLGEKRKSGANFITLVTVNPVFLSNVNRLTG